MTALSELLPAGGAGKVMDFVASGTLPNGKAVVLKSDGTVEVVGETSTAVSESIPAGSAAVFNSGDTENTSVAFDPNTVGKFVVVYKDVGNSNYGTAVVGTVSGTSLSFGSEYIFNSAASYIPNIAFDPNTAGKFVVVYEDGGNGSRGTAIVGTTSGTTLAFGSSYAFAINPGTSSHIISFDPNTTGTFVVAYRGSSGPGTATIGIVSGTTITYGSEYVYSTTSTGNPSVSFDPNTAGKFVVIYSDAGNLSYGKAIVGTVSSTAISFGSKYTYAAYYVGYNSISFDPNTTGTFVIAYMNADNSDHGRTRVGTYSGTSITFGTEVVFNSNTTSYISVAFNPNASGKVVISWKYSAGHINTGTVTGTSITLGTTVLATPVSVNADHLDFAFDPNYSGKFVMVYKNWSNLEYGEAILGQFATTITTTNLTSTNFVGITTEAIADTATGSITLQGGVSTNQSSLTSGSTYYVQADGTVSTVSTAPAVNIGKALNATTLKLKGLSV